MNIFYSKSARGFYNTSDHGTRAIVVRDTAWVRPTITASLQPGERIEVDGREVINDTDAPMTVTGVPNMSIEAPVVSIPNPDCKIPSDAVEITGDHHEALLAAESSGKIIQADANGSPIAVDRPAPTAGEIEAAKIAAAETAVQKLLDDAAKAEGYDGILSAASYAALPVGEPFQAEGAAFALWRARCWARCYEVLAAVKAGTRDEPTISELLAEMPALVLP